jgi:hypothetical protein
MSEKNSETLSNIYINTTKVAEILEMKENLYVEDTCETIVASSVTVAANKCRIATMPKLIQNMNL